MRVHDYARFRCGKALHICLVAALCSSIELDASADVQFNSLCTPGLMSVNLNTDLGAQIMVGDYDQNTYLGNNINHEYFLTANRTVSGLRLYFSKFLLDSGLDYLTVRETRTDGSTLVHSLTGHLADVTGQPYQLLLNQANFQKRGTKLTLTTDPNYPSGHIRISQFEVTGCNPSAPVDAMPMNIFTHEIGFLQGTHDTVHFRFSAGTNSDYSNITTWVEYSSSNTPDFDVYARCNAAPTPTQYDFRAYSSDAMEFLSLDNSACAGGEWNIAVNSYNGWGAFGIVYGRMKASNRKHLYVAFDPPRTTAEMDAFAATLAPAARLVYGYTEGQVLIDQFHVCPTAASCPQTPDVVYQNCSPPTHTHPGSAPVTHVCPGHEGHRVLAHEFGHLLFGALEDEYYYDPSGPDLVQCGHTIMGDHSPSFQNNLCAGKSGLGFTEHPKDPISGAPAINPLIAQDWNTGWYRMRTRGFVDYQPYTTPLNYDYYNHDFNGAIQVIKYY